MTSAYQASYKETDKDFFPVRFKAVEGSPRRRRTRFLRCSDPVCGRERDIGDNGEMELPPPVVRKKFLQLGWEIGKDRTHDLCPVCVANQRDARRKPKEEPVDAKASAMGPPPQMMVGSGPIEPKKMDVDERRIIFAAIDERWAGKEAGYTSPWTDQAIANHLGVPLAWVIEVRAQFFGEVRDNQEIRDLLERAKAAAGLAAKHLVEAEALQKETKGMIVRANAMTAALTELRQSVEGLAAIASRIERSVK